MNQKLEALRELNNTLDKLSRLRDRDGAFEYDVKPQFVAITKAVARLADQLADETFAVAVPARTPVLPPVLNEDVPF